MLFCDEEDSEDATRNHRCRSRANRRGSDRVRREEVSSIFSETLTQMLAEPVAATLRSLEQTRDSLVKAMDVVASTSGRDASEELPKLTGMPMVDVNEISRIIVIEKPRILSLLGRSMLVSHVRRKPATVYDRALLEFLSLYANRLRRWMEQSINALRNAFNAFADIHRAHFEAPLAAAGATDPSAIQNDLRVLRQWGRSEAVGAISN